MNPPRAAAQTLAGLIGQDRQAVALLAPGREPLTYAALTRQIARTVSELRAAGVQRGDRVAVVLPNGPEMATCFLGTASAACCAPLNPAYRDAEFGFYLDDLQPKAVIVLAGSETPVRAAAAARAIQVLELQPDHTAPGGVFGLGVDATYRAPELAERGDIALVLHTSGTTSRPKIVPLTHANLCASAQQVGRTLALTPDDRCLNVMPLFHIHGLIAALSASLAAGGSVVCTPGFVATGFFDWLAEFAPSWYTAVPTMHQAIVARAASQSPLLERVRLRFIRSSSASLPPSVMADLERHFAAPVVEAYGMTEASHQMTSNPLPPHTRKPGSVGLPAGVDVAILLADGQITSRPEGAAVGEVVIAGSGVTAGYESNADANREAYRDGWFRTGDLGYLDDDGYLFLTGRTKEIINRGGEKISPREIDEVLLGHPAVAGVVTFAIPDPTLGEDVGAAVVLTAPSQVTGVELQAFAAERLADHKVPRLIVFLDELPKGATGKLQRIGLAARLGITGVPAQAARAYAAPRTDDERTLAAIWSEVLKTERVGLHDDFFDLGGDSVLAAQVLTRVADRFGVRVPMFQIFNTRTLDAFASSLRAASDATPARPPIARVAPGDAGPLSFAQERMWFLSQFADAAAAYLLPMVVHVTGALDLDALREALQRVAGRHALLRTTYAFNGGRPTPAVAAAAEIPLDVVDAAPASGERVDQLAERMARAAASTPIDLTTDLPMRAKVVRLGPADQLLAVTVHHIASDGWSKSLLFRELAAEYAAARAKTDAALPALPIAYSDYAAWQRALIDGAEGQRLLAFWTERLAGAPHALNLPTDRPRPARQAFTGSVVRHTLAPALADRLKTVARAHDSSLYMLLLAAFNWLIGRYAQQTDILVGTPTAGRSMRETEGLIGLFVNTLVIRADLSGDPTFSELLGRVRNEALAAYEHQDLPLERLIDALHVARNLDRAPLFQVLFQLRNYPEIEPRFEGTTSVAVPVDPGTAPFDLSLDITESADGLACALNYCDALFDRSTAAGMLADYAALVDAVAARPDLRRAELPALRGRLSGPSSDRQAAAPVPVAASAGRSPVLPADGHATLHALFDAQVARTPQHVALTCRGESLTYEALQVRAKAVARRLRALGAGPNVLVGLCMERSLDLVAGLLGILQTGAAYLPIDLAYPAERLAFMLADADAPILLTQSSLLRQVPITTSRIVCIDEHGSEPVSEADDRPRPATTPDDLAYVIYTSGTTGQPKGTEITHRNVVRLFASTEHWFGFDDRDVWTLFHSTAFDFSVWELFGALLYGGRLVVVPYVEARSPDQFHALLRTEGVTVLNQTPSAFRQLAAADAAAGPSALSLRYVIFGGEALNLGSLRPWFDRHGDVQPRLINMYGITETTVHVTYRPLTRQDVDAGSVIGVPIPDLEVHIFDEARQPVAVGEQGEMFVGGAGVARGYLRRPELTAARFVDDHLGNRAGARLYKTGDLARRLPDGDLEYLGRADDQVKIRGFRIELGEIESVLYQHPDVADACVALRQDPGDEPRLVGYLVGRGAVHLAAVRTFLRAKLPEYMVPAAFVILDAMPLTASGKIDRRTLPAPDARRPDLDVAFAVPAGELERQIAEVWQRVLRVSSVGLHDNFFDLGGNSLLLVQVYHHVRSLTPHRTWSMVDLFRYPTVHGLARFLGPTDLPAEPSLSSAQDRGRRQRALLTGSRGSTGARR